MRNQTSKKTRRHGPGKAAETPWLAAGLALGATLGAGASSLSRGA